MSQDQLDKRALEQATQAASRLDQFIESDKVDKQRLQDTIEKMRDKAEDTRLDIGHKIEMGNEKIILQLSSFKDDIRKDIKCLEDDLEKKIDTNYNSLKDEISHIRGKISKHDKLIYGIGIALMVVATMSGLNIKLPLPL